MRTTFPDGYWPKEMPEAARYESISDFEVAVYPIWMGIETKDRENEEKLTVTEISKLDVLLEVGTMHRQDVAIRRSGFKPTRSFQTEAGAEESRRRSAAGKKFGQWRS